ncbi:polyprenyl synthetase family protein [Clostridium sp.]|uniref:polyprenyl synthetase family protein n=1 Tax=Clostridium sp. TaxID=1506 RepID=UPI003463B39F
MINLECLKEDIDKCIDSYFKGNNNYNKLIYDSMGYSMRIGGKRIRPMLLLLSYSLYNDNYKDIMPMAISMEMIHTYSLIHDDLPAMDNDDLRRGKPTNHKVYGEAIAVLSGDGLLNEAMNILFQMGLKYGEKALKAGYLISESSGVEGMIGGQVVDILSEGKNIDLDELLYMHKNKTGALIKASILSGAIMGEAKEDDLKILDSFGEKLGLAFQIKDDILDITGDTNTLGKTANSDINNQKSNFITFFGLDECIKKCSDLTNQCIEDLKSLNGDTKEMERLTKMLLERNF